MRCYPDQRENRLSITQKNNDSNTEGEELQDWSSKHVELLYSSYSAQHYLSLYLMVYAMLCDCCMNMGYYSMSM